MADITPNRLTQLDIVKRAGTDGNTLRVSKVLHETNPLMQDMQFMEASDRNVHLVAKTSDLGETPDVRNFNEGVGETRATIESAEERVILLEKYAKMDNLIYEGPNGKALRQQENDHIVEKIGQTINRHLLYGSPADLAVEGNYINGLASRRPALTSKADRYHNCINNGNTYASGINTSVYIVQHGIGYTYGVYPNASSAGIKVENLGRRTEDLANGKSMEIVSTLFQVGFGLVVEHPASFVRIANVSPWDDGEVGAQILQPSKLIEGLNMIDNPSKAVIYMDRQTFVTLSIDAIWKNNVNYNAKDPYGNMLMTFMGVPIRIMDQISTAEDLVS